MLMYSRGNTFNWNKFFFIAKITTHKMCNYVQFVANQTDKVPNVLYANGWSGNSFVFGVCFRSLLFQLLSLSGSFSSFAIRNVRAHTMSCMKIDGVAPDNCVSALFSGWLTAHQINIRQRFAEWINYLIPLLSFFSYWNLAICQWNCFANRFECTN